jgi:hypothetical protein
MKTLVLSLFIVFALQCHENARVEAGKHSQTQPLIKAKAQSPAKVQVPPVNDAQAPTPAKVQQQPLIKAKAQSSAEAQVQPLNDRQAQVNVRDYGARGDGTSNDYPALKKAVARINAQKGGTLYFPPGNYYLDVYHQPKNNNTSNNNTSTNNTSNSSTSNNKTNSDNSSNNNINVDAVGDLEFKGCDGLKIYGEKAVISVRGNFRRTVTRKTDKHTFSSITAITPLKISNCKNVTISGLELDGNVDQMTRDKKVNESGGYLLFINKSVNVKLQDLYIHHAQTDGIYIRNFSKDVQGENVVSANNARQGMSIIQLERGVFNNCKFINTGITGGGYGRHAPSAGVDIEPNHQTQRVLDIRFNNCIFGNNRGPQLVVSHPGTTRQLYFNNCRFQANASSNKLAVLVNAKEVTFDGCTFELGKGNIYPARKKGSSSVFKNCLIRSSSSGIIAINTGSDRSVVVDHCTLEYTGKEKISTFFPYIDMKEMVFTNNVVRVPAQYYKDKGASGQIHNSKKISGLQYMSNGKQVKPKVSVKGSRVAN